MDELGRRLTLNHSRIADRTDPLKDGVSDVAANFGFGEEAGETGFLVRPFRLVAAVDDEEGVAWFAKEAEEPGRVRFDAGGIEDGDGGDLAAGDGGAALVDPVEVDPHEEAKNGGDGEHRSQREARAPGGAANPGAEAVRE